MQVVIPELVAAGGDGRNQCPRASSKSEAVGHRIAVPWRVARHRGANALEDFQQAIAHVGKRLNLSSSNRLRLQSDIWVKQISTIVPLCLEVSHATVFQQTPKTLPSCTNFCQAIASATAKLARWALRWHQPGLCPYPKLGGV